MSGKLYFIIIITLLLSVDAAGTISNTYIKINDPDSTSIENLKEQVRNAGGRVIHSFPPNEFICFVPDGSLDGLKASFMAEIERLDDLEIIKGGRLGYEAWRHLKKASLEDIPEGNKCTDELNNSCGFRTVKWPEFENMGKDDSKTPKYERVTNNYLIGDIAVGILLMESEGETENWDADDEAVAVAAAVAAYEWLSTTAAEMNVQVNWIYEIHTRVPTPYEPIQIKCPSSDLLIGFGWINDALDYLDSGQGWDGLFDYADRLRENYKTNWAYALFIIKNDYTCCFPDLSTGYSIAIEDAPYDGYIRTPFAVSTFRRNASTYDARYTIRHETTHVFGAADEYGGAEQCQSAFSCNDVSGYLRYENQNCEFCDNEYECFMHTSSKNEVCPYTLGHIGWVDSDADGAPDPIDPNSELWASIFPVVPGDLVRIFTISGGFVNLISCTENNAVAPIYQGSTRGVFWDGHNYDNQQCNAGLYKATVNDGDPFVFELHISDISHRPVIKNGAFYNDSITWYLDSSWAYTSCYIYDNENTLVARPVWDKAYGYLGNYGIDISSINCFDCYARIWAWRPDGALSNSMDVPFDNFCIDSLPWSSPFNNLISNYATKVEITPDNGYAILSKKINGKTYGLFRKFNSQDCSAWARTFEQSTENQVSSSFYVTSDSGFIIVGQQENLAYAVKMDSLGSIKWDKYYSGNDVTSVDIRQTLDGGFIIAGSMTNPLSGFKEAALLKTDTFGNELWRKRIGDGINNSDCNSVIQAVDGGFVAAGRMHPGMAFETIGLVIKTDVNGTVEWTYQFGNSAGPLDGVYEVIETYESDFVAVGTVYDTLKIARLDENGNAIWNRLIRGPQGSSAFGLCIAQTNDSGFIVGGFTYQGLYLVKTYAGGDTVWTKIIEDGYKAYSIKQDTGDGYVVVGSAGQHSYLLRLGPQPFYICGDVYADGAINLLDIQFLVNFIYYSGPDPEHIESANVNCDARVNMLDVLYLIAFIYENGPAPCCEECCL